MFPPPGVRSTAPQNAHTAPESRNLYRNTPTNQTPRKSPQNAPQHEQPTPAHKQTRERWNEPGRLFKIKFYTNPDRVHAQREAHQQTHTGTPERKKNPGNIAGAVNHLFIFNNSPKSTNGKAKIHNIINSFHLQTLHRKRNI